MTKLLFGRHVGSFRALHYDGIPLVESRDGLIIRKVKQIFENFFRRGQYFSRRKDVLEGGEARLYSQYYS